MDVASLNSGENKEYLLIGQMFDLALRIFRFSNVRLQHKNGRTCPMTDRYLHHWFVDIWGVLPLCKLWHACTLDRKYLKGMRACLYIKEEVFEKYESMSVD